MRRSKAVWPSLLVLSLLAVPAGAEVFRVTLNNGQVFDTAYQPQEASWDASMVLLLDDVGNWIGVSKGDVQQVVSLDENGFGIRISRNTFEIGISANDAESQAEALLASGGVPGQGADPRLQMLQLMVQQQQATTQQRQAEQNYSVKQFVEPGQTQGIPARFIGQPSTPVTGPGTGIH
jgi:hypothetical protein